MCKKFNRDEYIKECSDFMGLVEAKPYKGAYTIAHPNEVPASFSELFHSELEGESWYVYPKFDSDWNWIMEIIIKIQSLDIVHDNTRNYDSVFKEWTCSFSPSYKTHDFGHIVGKSKSSEKEAVVQAIWEFLQWYNQEEK